jgi:O-antigen/teichoic acid export membrane protein
VIAVGADRAAGPAPLRRAEVSLLASAGLLQVAANAAAAVVATIALGAAGRGEMVLGASIGGVCALLGGLGSGSALRSILPAAPAARRWVLGGYAWCTAAGAVGAAVLAVLACLASAPLLGPALSTPAFLAAVGLQTAVQVVVTQAGEAWYADGAFRRGGTWAAACAAGGLAALAATASVTGDGAAALLGAQGTGSALVCAVQLLALRRAGLLVRDRPHRLALRLLVARGAPVLGLTLGLAVALRADRYVLGALAGPAAVGVYSLAATLSEVSRVVPQAVGQFFVHHVALGGRYLARWVALPVAAAGAGGAVAAALGWVLIVPVFGAPFEQARGLLLVLVVAEACFAPYAVASRGLIGGGRTRVAGALGLTAAVAAVGCYLVGAHLGGGTGLAVGCVLLYSGLSAAAVTLFLRRGQGPVLTTSPTAASGERDATQPHVRDRAERSRPKATNSQNSGEAE